MKELLKMFLFSAWVFAIVGLSLFLGHYMADEPMFCSYNVTHEKTINTINNITNYQNVTTMHTNNYEKLLTFYPRTPRECGLRKEWIEIQGISMQPFVFDGDIIYIEPVRFKEVELGDVISFTTENGNTLHAVVGIYPEFLVTAGYNNLRQDKVVYPEQITHRWCFEK